MQLQTFYVGQSDRVRLIKYIGHPSRYIESTHPFSGLYLSLVILILQTVYSISCPICIHLPSIIQISSVLSVILPTWIDHKIHLNPQYFPVFNMTEVPCRDKKIIEFLLENFLPGKFRPVKMKFYENVCSRKVYFIAPYLIFMHCIRCSLNANNNYRIYFTCLRVLHEIPWLFGGWVTFFQNMFCSMTYISNILE